MAPRDFCDDNRGFVDGDGGGGDDDDDVGDEQRLMDADGRRQLLAAIRREDREYANREMRRQDELREQMQLSVNAMEVMIESQQRIAELTRNLNELRELHRQMLEAGVGQERSDDDDEDNEEKEKVKDLVSEPRIASAKDKNVISSYLEGQQQQHPPPGRQQEHT